MKDEYRELARAAVRKSVVLLKNEGAILPLRPETVNGSIAVMGPLADAVLMDWYAGHPLYACTPLDGLRELYGNNRVVYTDCRDTVSFTTQDGRPLILTDSGDSAKKVLAVGTLGEKPAFFHIEDWGWGSQTLADAESGLRLGTPFSRQEQHASADYAQSYVAAGAKSTLNWFVTTLFNIVPQEGGMILLRTWDNRRIAAPETKGPVLLREDRISVPQELFRMKVERDGLAAAADAAKKAVHVIVVGGNDPMINGREEVDRPSLNLPPRQEELIRRVSAINPRTILVLVSGYPYTCKDISAQVPAVIWMAHGIQETGRGLADIIGGGYSPAGRLPLTWYEDEKQLPPIMEYDIISAGSTYQYFSGPVLWPFGHGLSYSSFEYSQLVIDKPAAGEDETLSVSFKLKNTGSVMAEEVPQMYVTVSGSSRKRRPLKSLKGFTRLSLAAGEEQVIRFTLPVKELAFWENRLNRFCLEAGYCSVLIGASSADIRLSGGFELCGESLLPRKLSGPIYAESFDDYSGCFLHEKRGSGIPAVFNGKDNTPSKDGAPSLDGGWICFTALDFAGGAERLSAIVQGEPGSRIEFRLDSPDGVLAGTLAVPNTGTFTHFPVESNSPRRLPVWAFAEAVTEKICGIHDLYLVLYGKTGVWRLDIQ
jgi:beta-glucosidase